MGQLCIFTILCLALMLLLHDSSARRKSTSSKKPTNDKPSTSSNKPHQGSKTQPEGSNPSRGGVNPGRYPHQNPAGGSYPSIGGSYPNWNPNNKILSPRYRGGFGGPGYGIGGSPFSKSVDHMGHTPSIKSKGFAKKAMVAAGVGTMTGMAVGYGVGRYPQPHFHFRSRKEQRYYNHYMHRNHGMKSTDTNDYGRDYAFNPPPQAQTYEKHMDKCMNITDLLQNRDAKISSIQRNDTMTGSLAISNGTSERVGTAENGTSEVPVLVESPESNDTVSITEIGYPALIQQMKARKCVELYMVYSKSFLQKQIQEHPNSHSDPNGHSGPLILLTTTIMALCNTLLL